jgi:hypothetical protein
VRVLACAATVLAVLALAACGGSDVEVDLVWAGPPEAGEAGGVSVNGFASFQGSVDEPWERSPALAAGEFLRLDERTAARTTIDARAESGEGTAPQTVVVTLDGLADDSVRAERWTLGFEPEGEIYVLTAALRELRCRPGRGHDDFSAAPCV